MHRGHHHLLHATVAASAGFLVGVSAASLLTYVVGPGPWHLLIQSLVGIGCAWLAVRYLRTHPVDGHAHRRRTILSAAAAPPLWGSVVLVLLMMVELEPSAPPSLEGLFGSIWLTWWFLVPVGVIAALFTWLWTRDRGTSRDGSGRPDLRS